MPNNPTSQSIRLNRFLAERLGISRREADNLISEGKVFVDEKQAKLGDRIDKSNKVCYNRKIIPFETEYLYVLMNKPEGYVCSKKKQGEAETIYNLLPKKYKTLKTVGRLDKNSSGLILLTNDGDFSFKMTHPSFEKTKVYHVELDRSVEPIHQQIIADFGIELSDGISQLGLTRLEQNEFLGKTKIPQKTGERRLFEVSMNEGRNRQIRRTFDALGYKVKTLHRVKFGNYSLGNVKPGEVVKIKI